MHSNDARAHVYKSLKFFISEKPDKGLSRFKSKL